MTEKKQSSDDRPIRLADLAAELGKNRGFIKRFVESRGFVPYKMQEGPNKPSYLSAADADALRRVLEDEKNHRFVQDKEDVPTGLSGIYAIEVPAYDYSIRIKIGWSNNIADRLSTYRTIVPDLRVSRIWPCSDSWIENAALKWADKNGKRISQEVFEFEDIEVSLTSLDGFFASLGIKSQPTPS